MFEEIGNGVVKRREKKILGLFIDGIGLDRACRRLNRKVELSALVRGVTSGLTPTVSRYYTLIPYEDDSRQRSFLDAVSKADLEVVVKRLPPKGVQRQASIDPEMSADIVAFALGHDRFSNLSLYEGSPVRNKLQSSGGDTEPASIEPVKRIVVAVCPSRDIAYSLAMVKELGVDTVNADFGKFNSGDVLKSAAKWIDLSDSETIWRE